MLLTIDVGNTNTVLGVFDGAVLKVHWRLTTRRDATSDELALTAQGLLASGGRATDPPGDVIVASVVSATGRSLTSLGEPELAAM